MPTHAAPSRRAAALGITSLIATIALSAGALTTLGGWPARVPLHLAFYVVAGLAWLVAIASLRRTAPTKRVFAFALVAGLGLRVLALATPPAHSDDVYRYLWDARVQQHGINPYLYAPEVPALSPLRDDNFAKMNNRQLPTIYPPAAQLFFRLSARPAAPLAGWKLAVGASELATAALLYVGAGPTAALGWLLSPLVLVELDVNGHVDALAIALLCAALVALQRSRRAVAGALLGAATAVKLLPIFLIVALRDWRLRLAALGLIAACVLPYAGAGTRMVGSLGEYGRRWRSNDGAFSLLYVGAQAIVGVIGKRAPTDETRLGSWTRLVTGRDRDEAYPDELASALARALAFGCFVMVVTGAAWSARRRALAPYDHALHLTELGLGAFLLLTPALHPWYVVWCLPAVLLGAGKPSGRSAAWLWMAATAPLGHLPLVAYLAGSPWHEALWPRLVEHVPALVLVTASLRRLSSRTNVV